MIYYIFVDLCFNFMNQSPKDLGFHMPAEWERQEAVWLSWPLNPQTWPGRLAAVQQKFAELAAAISRFEKVCINCAKEAQPAALKLLQEANANLDYVIFYGHPTDDAWCRDHGPTFVKNHKTSEIAVVDWKYNAWGGKFPPWDKDDAIPKLVADALGFRHFASPIVCEGGAIEVNGDGLLLTTESVLLNPNRNPDLSKANAEQVLKDYTGAGQICWLGGGLANDDTDGHIDNLARFYKPDGVVAVIEKNSRSPNYRALQENRERLEGLRTPAGGHFDFAWLQLPENCRHEDQPQRLLPASYANFLAINGAVIAPTFRQPKADARAAGLLGELFPKRKIIPIDCLDLLLEGGAVHCVTQQQPK